MGCTVSQFLAMKMSESIAAINQYIYQPIVSTSFYIVKVRPDVANCD